MAELTIRETIDIDKLFRMESGYVLDFSNASFRAFVYDSTGVDVNSEDSANSYYGLSKAKSLRLFFRAESSYLSGRLLAALIEYVEAKDLSSDVDQRMLVIERIKRTADRLLHESPIDNLDAMEVFQNEKAIHILVSSIQDSIRKNQPEAALDRLHTFLTHLLRDVCSRRSIRWSETMPLHSLMGLYRKFLARNNLLESEMTDRILGTAISLLDAYNHVRNQHSFAHPNQPLSEAESSFVVSAVLNVVKFIYTLEDPASNQKQDNRSPIMTIDDIPF
jgi:hypothetical protein